jgi:hypothetical protein
MAEALVVSAAAVAARDEFVRAICAFVKALMHRYRNDADVLKRITDVERQFNMMVVNVADKMKDVVVGRFACEFDNQMAPLYDRVMRGDESFVRDIRSKLFHEMGFDALFEQASAKTRASMVSHIQVICNCAVNYLRARAPPAAVC